MKASCARVSPLVLSMAVAAVANASSSIRVPFRTSQQMLSSCSTSWKLSLTLSAIWFSRRSLVADMVLGVLDFCAPNTSMASMVESSESEAHEVTEVMSAAALTRAVLSAAVRCADP